MDRLDDSFFALFYVSKLAVFRKHAFLDALFDGFVKWRCVCKLINHLAWSVKPVNRSNSVYVNSVLGQNATTARLELGLNVFKFCRRFALLSKLLRKQLFNAVNIDLWTRILVSCGSFFCRLNRSV